MERLRRLTSHSSETTSEKSKRKSSAMSSAKLSHRSKCVVILGASKCGKTAFVRRLLFGKFSASYTPTTEEFYEKAHVYQGYVFNLELIDTGSPFEFPAMRDLNIRYYYTHHTLSVKIFIGQNCRNFELVLENLTAEILSDKVFISVL